MLLAHTGVFVHNLACLSRLCFLLTSSHVLTISGVHVIGLQILEADMLYRFNDHIAVNSVTGM
jgi:hypothetical protein